MRWVRMHSRSPFATVRRVGVQNHRRIAKFLHNGSRLVLAIAIHVLHIIIIYFIRLCAKNHFNFQPVRYNLRAFYATRFDPIYIYISAFLTSSPVPLLAVIRYLSLSLREAMFFP